MAASLEGFRCRVLYRVLCGIVFVALAGGGCSSPADNTPPPPPLLPRVASTQPSPARSTPSPLPTLSADLRQKQIAFLKKLTADKEFPNVTEVRADARGQLALILQRELPPAACRKLLESALARLMQEFPGEDLAIVAYGPSPRSSRLGMATLDAATLQMTYQTPSAPE